MKIFIIHFPARENLPTWIEQTRVLLHSWVWLTIRLIFIHHFHHSHHSNSESFLNKWLTFLRCWQARNMIRVRETNLWQFKTSQPSHSDDNCLVSWLGTLQRQHSSLLLSISIDSTQLDSSSSTRSHSISFTKAGCVISRQRFEVVEASTCSSQLMLCEPWNENVIWNCTKYSVASRSHRSITLCRSDGLSQKRRQEWIWI